MSEASRLLEEERHLILMALGLLAVRRPGWDYALRAIAAKFDGEDLFAAFKMNDLVTWLAAAPPPPSSPGEGEA